MSKKYEFTGETKKVDGHTLHRIRAVRSFGSGDVTKGELGGWIEKEENLSHKGDCWVGLYARVYGNATVSGNAQLFGKAKVYGNAKVYGKAWVSDRAEVYGNARVYNNAWVSGRAQVSGDTHVYGTTRLCENARVK